MISPINTVFKSFYRPTFQRNGHNPIPSQLVFYKEKTGDFAFCDIDGLTCPACGEPMLSQKTFDNISQEIETANPQECFEILQRNSKYMTPVKRSIFEKILNEQEQNPGQSISNALEHMDSEENEQMLQTQLQVLQKIASIARAAGDKKLVARQHEMFKKIKSFRHDLPTGEKELLDNILFSYEDQLKTKKRPINPGKLAKRIKDADFSNENLTRAMLHNIRKDKKCPEYEIQQAALSSMGHILDIIENRKKQRDSQAVIQNKKDDLLAQESKKLQEIKTLTLSLPEDEASNLNAIIDEAQEKIITQQSLIGRKPLINRIRELNISSPEILNQILEVINRKIEDNDNYRIYILQSRNDGNVVNKSYGFSREEFIDKIKRIKTDDKLKEQILEVAGYLPSSKSEEKYSAITGFLEYEKTYKEPDLTRIIAKSFLAGSVSNTDHFEAVRGESKGLDIVTNYVAMHNDCNCKKGTKTPYQWFREDPKRESYFAKYLDETQAQLNSGKINDIKYVDYTMLIAEKVLRMTNGYINLIPSLNG